MQTSPSVAGQPAGENTRPGIWQLAWPAILGNLLMSLVQLINIKVVGGISAEALAAVSTGGRLFFITQAVMMAVSAGTTALVARAWGAGDRIEANAINRASLVLGGIFSLFLTLPGVLIPQTLAGVFDLEPEIISLTADYVFWISVFNFAFVLHMILGASLRAAGDTMTPLWIGVLTNMVNVPLVYLLVFGGYGVPALGVKGAAIAAGLAFFVGSLVLLYLLLRDRLVVGIGRVGDVTKARLQQLVQIGIPAGLEQAVFQIGFLVFLGVVAKYGTAPFAAYNIGVNLLSFSFTVGFGFSIAGATLAGQYLGANDPDGAMAAGWRTMALSIMVMLVFTIVIIAGAETLARFMINDEEVIRLTVIFIYILGAVQPLMAIEFSIGGALRGSGDTRFPLYSTMAGLIGVRVTLTLLFYFMGFDVVWIFGALIFDYVVKASMLIYRFRSGAWQRILS